MLGSSRLVLLACLPLVAVACVGEDPQTVAPAADASTPPVTPGDGGSEPPPSNDAGDASTPVEAGDAGFVRPVLAIGSGGYSPRTCAVLADGSVKCWGDNLAGGVGDGTTSPALSAKAVANPPAATRFVQVVTGQDHTCARADGGALFCWGGNGSGMLGDGTQINRPDPTRVSGVAKGADLASAQYTSCAVDGVTVKCWGAQANGALAHAIGPDDFKTAHDAFEDGLQPPAITNATSLAVGQLRGCVVRAGAVKCWGSNSAGQTGAGGTCVAAECVPTPVPGLQTGVDKVRAGVAHTCAVLSSGAVKCWGGNDSLQLGSAGGPGVLDVTLPEGIRDLALGGNHSCALGLSGDVYCWGRNTSGQSGQTKSSTASPAKVAGLDHVVQLAAGAFHSCALLESGEVRCWGANRFNLSQPDIVGCLGNGSTTMLDSDVPVRVLGLP